MKHSNIVLDLVNGKVELEISLKRAKLLLTDLRCYDLVKWINNELTGYSESDELPAYRIIRGELMGSYIVGTFTRQMQYNNVSIPLGQMPSDLQEELLTVRMTPGIHEITRFMNSDDSVCKAVPADCFPLLSKFNGNPYMKVHAARVVANKTSISDIVQFVEQALLDILMKIESEYGNLDDYDVGADSVKEENIQKFAHNMKGNIYKNCIVIGDNNTIKGSDISS